MNPLREHVDTWTVGAPQEVARTDFLHKTYQHLALAIGAFVGIEVLLFAIPGIELLLQGLLQSRFGWLGVLAGYMVVSMVAERWARSAVAPGRQYLGLGLFVLAEALIFLPLLYVAVFYVGAEVLPKAAIITGVTFGGLTLSVLLSKRDFSFLGGILRVAGFAALGLIVVSILFGFSLGAFFSFAMVAFAAGAIVYETSNVLHRYQTGQHVAAALALFASVGLLFWYVLQLVIASRD